MKKLDSWKQYLYVILGSCFICGQREFTDRTSQSL